MSAIGRAAPGPKAAPPGEQKDAEKKTMSSCATHHDDDGGGDHDAQEEKRRWRLEKNKIAARLCRSRKKQKIEELERETNLLEAENLGLRMQLQIGDEGEHRLDEEELEKIRGEIGALVSSETASEADIGEAIDKYKAEHLDYGRNYRSAVEYHLRHVERLLRPNPLTAMAMAAVAGKNAIAPNSGLLPKPPPSDDGGEGGGGGASPPSATSRPVVDATH